MRPAFLIWLGHVCTELHRAALLQAMSDNHILSRFIFASLSMQARTLKIPYRTSRASA